MTQHPPLQSAPRSEGRSQDAGTIWYEQTRGQSHTPSSLPDPPFPAESRPAALARPGAATVQPAKLRRLAELGVVAALAAVLASTGTYAVTRVSTTQSPTAQTNPSATASASLVAQADSSAPNWSVTAAAVSPSVVSITVTSTQSSGQGSGVIIDTKGHILTNNHVVTGAGAGSQLSVTLNDKRTYGATVVGTDPSTDLAVIKLTNAPSDLKAIALGDANVIKVGDQVMAVGNPLGLAGTVTTGIVSALNRPVTTSDAQSDPTEESTADPVVTNAIQISAAINPGNSGGALVNSGGQLIGINSAIASLGSSGSSSSQSGSIGIGFAIPVNEARSIAEQLITSGKATHPYLGVSSEDGVVADGSAKRAAAVLTDVAAGSPAEAAGLRVGDSITEVDGESIDGSLSLVAQVRERSVGDKLTLKIVRDGQTKNINVTLTSKPTTAP
ncbi:MAG TPA: trypsin-like peptidase domain-containing protein [Dermatophilaceae bacterium]|nr:trypsin-like peptidase domain-containing protein [Dermatophilaceae bacterium]